MRKLLILADDLTGAADCANACATTGLNTFVSLSGTPPESEYEVLSIDCDTRHLPSADAAKRFSYFMQTPLLSIPGQFLFKKIDSTLRGNIAAELRAVLDERRRQLSTRVIAIMAPAFPAVGRTTVGGFQLLRGSPIHDTEVWQHSDITGVAHLPGMLAQAGLISVEVSLAELRGDVTQLANRMRYIARDADVIVCDAETDQDLLQIASASLLLSHDLIWVGSAGLACQLPLAAGLRGHAQRREDVRIARGPTLFVVGSTSTIARRQVDTLADSERVTKIEISPRILLNTHSESDRNRTTALIVHSLQGGKDTIVVIGHDEWIEPRIRRCLPKALGQMLIPCASFSSALVATGGETARAIMDAWRIESFKILGEVEPGLPCSLGQVHGRTIPLLTKAGAFGEQDTLLACQQFLLHLKEAQDYPHLGHL